MNVSVYLCKICLAALAMDLAVPPGAGRPSTVTDSVSQ
jgi:hypothetical protein